MKKILFFLFLTFKLFAGTIPTELQLLIESIGNPGVLGDTSEQTFTEVELQTLKKQIISIDHNLSILSDEAALLLIKNEVYKKILTEPELNTIPPTNQTLSEVKSKLQNSKKSLAPFLSWMLEAILVDIENLMGKVELELFYKTANAQTKEKLDTLLFYPVKFYQQPIEEFNLELKNLTLAIIRNISTVSTLLVNFSELKNQPVPKGNNTLELLFNLALKNSSVKKSVEAKPKMEESEAIKALSEPIVEPTATVPTNPKTFWIPEEEPIIDIDSSIQRKMEDKNYDWTPNEKEKEE